MSDMPSHMGNQGNRNYTNTWKSVMELPEEPLDDAIKEKIVEVVAYIKSYEKDKLEARLVKEDKVLDPYKVFACKKKDPPKEETKFSNFDDDVPFHCRQNNYSHIGSYIGDYPLEDQSGPSPAAAIEKFFTEAVKSLARQKKTKEKEFAKLEKDIASMDYLIIRIEKYASEDTKKELKEAADKENKPDVPTIPEPALVISKPSVCDTQPLPALTMAEANKILSM